MLWSQVVVVEQQHGVVAFTFARRRACIVASTTPQQGGPWTLMWARAGIAILPFAVAVVVRGVDT